MRDIARHIGNAVPVRLGEVIGNSIIKHLEKEGVKQWQKTKNILLISDQNYCSY